MQTLTASEAQNNLYRLMDQSAESHQPILISGKRTNSVLISAEDWESIQETLYLLSVPGMRESIKEGMAEPVEENALRIWTGELAACVHQTSSEGCTKARGSWSKRQRLKHCWQLFRKIPSSPSPYEKLIGDLSGAYSAHQHQHRLVYQVLQDEQVVKVLRLWSH
ncbi:MAG: type II toxin-antitoxin system prevent-host-death family antitoxin [Rhodoferax sp.]|nr:type II toxin-antitoxin system prevent-host-death family antitoxin [Rhodoferax sp.]